MILRINRREWLAGSSLVALAAMVKAVPAAARKTGGRRTELASAPLSAVTLAPSIFADAQAANRNYLASLDPERLLHNFYLSAGMSAPKEIYGGWEAMGIAGHSLGHWLSAVSLIIANTGDRELTAQLDHCLSEMVRIQAAHGDGYCGGTTVERDGETIDGKIVFEEVRRGEISSHGFDLNGGWVPLYTWHKVHAGLIDAHRLAGNSKAMPIMLGVAGYLADVLEGLDDEQMQRVLAAEHGGLNESYADTFAITGNPRWLRLAQRLYHRAVLDPIVRQEDKLDGLHANTQIPKVIGLARLHELTDDRRAGNAARFFHSTVRHHHSYVIGGNSDREHFGPPDQRANRITEATCEACNSYNMLKLTRSLYGWSGDAGLFDYFERIHLNHIMAHQRPSDGRFVYFMPLASGARRIYSEPEHSFWCCVGSGMESHAKHAESIYWADDRELFVNLYIPSQLDWPEQGLELRLATNMPFGGDSTISIVRAPRKARSIAMRIPGWARSYELKLNGKSVQSDLRNGYATIDRRWQKGDTLELALQMGLDVEQVPDDPSLVAFRHGPLVLAADLGSASKDFQGLGPALVVRGDPSRELVQTDGGKPEYAATSATGEMLSFAPFFDKYDRRSAVYFPTFTPGEWDAKREEFIRAQQEGKALAARTVDTIYLGEMQPERDHMLVAGQSEVVNWNGRSARRVLPGGEMEFSLARRPGPATLRLIVWDWDAPNPFGIAVDGDPLVGEWPKSIGESGYVALDFPIPSSGEQGRDKAVVRIAAEKHHALIYEARMLEGRD